MHNINDLFEDLRKTADLEIKQRPMTTEEMKTFILIEQSTIQVLIKIMDECQVCQVFEKRLTSFGYGMLSEKDKKVIMQLVQHCSSFGDIAIYAAYFIWIKRKMSNETFLSGSENFYQIGHDVPFTKETMSWIWDKQKDKDSPLGNLLDNKAAYELS